MDFSTSSTDELSDDVDELPLRMEPMRVGQRNARQPNRCAPLMCCVGALFAVAAIALVAVIAAAAGGYGTTVKRMTAGALRGVAAGIDASVDRAEIVVHRGHAGTNYLSGDLNTLASLVHAENKVAEAVGREEAALEDASGATAVAASEATMRALRVEKTRTEHALPGVVRQIIADVASSGAAPSDVEELRKDGEELQRLDLEEDAFGRVGESRAVDASAASSTPLETREARADVHEIETEVQTLDAAKKAELAKMSSDALQAVQRVAIGPAPGEKK